MVSAEPPDASSSGPQPSRVVQLIESAKRHPLVIILVTSVALVAFLGDVTSMVRSGYRAISSQLNPYSVQYTALAGLDLEMSSSAVQKLLGIPSRNYDLCDVVVCGGVNVLDGDLLVYELPGGAVRAVFQDDQLMLYVVTQRANNFNPPILWLQKEEKGQLGKQTFAEVLADVEKPADTPTDVSATMTLRSVAYTETFAYGAPGRYEGFLLAFAPDGYAGDDARLDLDALGQLSSDSPAAPEISDRFRTGSSPNSYGVYRDDGAIGGMAHDAAKVESILFKGVA